MTQHDNLPPLPSPAGSAYGIDLYTDDQMREYAMAAIAALPGTHEGPFVWESTTSCYRKFITQATYERFSPRARAWYRPISEAGRQEAAPPGSPWRAIDSAPKDGTFVRLFGCYAGATTPIEHLGFWSADDSSWVEQSNGTPPLLFNVTHWAPRGPIPPLPEVKP